VFIPHHNNVYKTLSSKTNMANVTARVKIKGKNYEVDVDLDEALKVKSGKGNIMSAVASPQIFHDIRKATRVSKADLLDAFGTEDAYEIAKQIITKGEVQKTQEFRDEQRELKIKQIMALLLKNCSDQNGRPYTEDRLKRAIDEAHYAFDNRTAEQQMPVLLEKLKSVIPIKIDLKKIKITIPARFTGQVYGILNDFKESEEWLSNGDLQVIINIPVGMQLDFYDKLNSVTHGAIQSQELSKAE